jgi:hypothetical protein
MRSEARLKLEDIFGGPVEIMVGQRQYLETEGGEKKMFRKYHHPDLANYTIIMVTATPNLPLQGTPKLESLLTEEVLRLALEQGLAIMWARVGT